MSYASRVFSTKPHDREGLTAAARGTGHELLFFEVRLDPHTVGLAANCDAVCAFVNDRLDGAAFARIMHGFGCRLLGCDTIENAECLELGLRYADLEAVGAESDILSLHCPLTVQTHHLIDGRMLALMKDGVMLINTGRGALIRG